MKIKGESISQRTVIIGLIIILLGVGILVWLFSRTLILVELKPAEASLFIDNSKVPVPADGKAKKMTSAGSHEIRVEAENYITYKKVVDLPNAGSHKIDIELRRKPNQIVLEDENVKITDVDLVKYDNISDSVFYFANDRTRLYQAKVETNSDGSVMAKQNHLIADGLSGIKSTVWSPKSEAILLKKSDGYYFLDLRKIDLVSQKEKKYGENIGDLAWSPDDSKIAYYYYGENEQSLIFANKVNQDVERVLNLREHNISNPYLSWSPNSEWLIIIPRNQDVSSNKIFLFNAYTRKLSVLNESGGNLEAKYLDDGSRIIYSTYSKNPSSPINSVVSIMNNDGSEQRSTEIRALLDHVQWLGSDNFLAAYYNQDKNTEEIAVFNVSSKQIDGLSYALPSKVYLNQLQSTKNMIGVFTINKNMYGMSIK